MAFYPNYQLAPDYDNVGSLATLEGTVPTGGSRGYPPVNAYPGYDPGVERARGNLQLFHSGYPVVTWVLQGVDYWMEQYLRDTYCSSGYSGNVTCKTTTEDHDSYANYNAVMRLEKRRDIQRAQGQPVFNEYRIRLVLVEAL
jgi:hypothetical protein